MSMIVLHLRWEDAAADQYQRMLELLPDEPGLPGSSPHSRQLRRHGRAILDTEVWGDGDSAQRFLDGLPAVSAAAGLREPQVVAFSVPAMYARVYADQAARLAASAATRQRVPAPTGPQPVEQVVPARTPV